MPKNNLSEEKVSAVVRKIFEGASIQPQKKTVQKRIQAYQNQPEFRSLITNYGLDNVCRVSLNLLRKGAFQPAVLAATSSAASCQGSLQSDPTPLLVEETTPAPCGGETVVGERTVSDRVKQHDIKTEATHFDPSMSHGLGDLTKLIQIMRYTSIRCL